MMWFSFSLAVIMLPTLFVILIAAEQRKFDLRTVFVVTTIAAMLFGLAGIIVRFMSTK